MLPATAVSVQFTVRLSEFTLMHLSDTLISSDVQLDNITDLGECRTRSVVLCPCCNRFSSLVMFHDIPAASNITSTE